MRGALSPIEGVQTVNVTVGKKEFSVSYDPSKTTVEKMLQALDKAGEKSTVAN